MNRSEALCKWGASDLLAEEHNQDSCEGKNQPNWYVGINTEALVKNCHLVSCAANGDLLSVWAGGEIERRILVKTKAGALPHF